MPMKSKKQRAFLWMKHPEVAREFEEHTPKGAKLPERAGKMRGHCADDESHGKATLRYSDVDLENMGRAVARKIRSGHIFASNELRQMGKEYADELFGKLAGGPAIRGDSPKSRLPKVFNGGIPRKDRTDVRRVGRQGPSINRSAQRVPAQGLHADRKMPEEPPGRWPANKRRPKMIIKPDTTERGVQGRPHKAPALAGKSTQIGPGPGGGGLVGKRRGEEDAKIRAKKLRLMVRDEMYGKLGNFKQGSGRSFGPGPVWNTNPVPDFAGIFPGRDPKQPDKDARAQALRNESQRKRNAGVHGFLGKPPKPTLRATSAVQFTITAPRESEAKPRIFARVGFKPREEKRRAG